ncbi:T9SS type A sorting domain-containing protein [bacterium]|nr:T9SS type A sorting domain-containing protein [bacterium]
MTRNSSLLFLSPMNMKNEVRSMMFVSMSRQTLRVMTAALFCLATILAPVQLSAQSHADDAFTTVNASELFHSITPDGLRKAVPIASPQALTVAVPLASFPRLRASGNMLLADFPMPDGTTANLELRAMKLFSDDAIVVTQTAQGELRRALPDIRAYRGSVRGEEGSFVWMAVEGTAMTGSVLRDGVEYSFTTRLNNAPQSGDERLLTVYEATPEMKSFDCGVEDDLFIEDYLRGMPNGADAQMMKAGMDTLVARLAIDIDYEAFQHYGGVSESENYVSSLFTGVIAIYERDVAVTFEISYMRTWETEDPYSPASDKAALNTFTEYWRDNMDNVDRTLASLISRKPISANGVTQGLAWVNQLCSRTHGYAFIKLSGNNGNIEGHAGVWAHELGHNFGSPHTHACVWNPPIDSCYTAEPIRNNPPCFSSSDIHLIQGGGELMSYCHMRFGNKNVHKVFRDRVGALVRGNAERALCMNVTSTVRALELLTPSGGEEICAGMPLTITWSAQGNNDFSILLSTDNGATWETILIDDLSRIVRSWDWVIPSDFPVGDTYRIRIIDNKNPDLSDQMEASFTVKEGTVITDQVFWRNVCIGEGAWFYVHATGAGELSYQWKKNGENIDGETGNELQLQNLQEADNLSTYTCAITGDCGTIESEPALLKVFTTAVIVQDLVHDTACLGGSGRFEVVAEGSNLTYKWYFRSPTGVNRTLENDSSVLIIQNVTQDDYGAYWCNVNSSCGQSTTMTRFLMVPTTAVTVLDPAKRNMEIPAGSQFEIRWKQYCLNSVKIELSVDGAANWTEITGSADANAGSYIWNVPTENSDRCYLRISSADDGSVFGTSEQFKIKDMPVREYALPSVGFSWVAVGTPSERPLGIANTGRGDLEVTSTEIIGTTEVVLKNAAPFTITPGSDYELMLEYTPAAAAPMEGQLVIRHNAVGSPDTLEIFGEGYIASSADGPAHQLRLELAQNWPNPVSLSNGALTQIRYDLTRRSGVSLTLYNTLGQQVRTLSSGTQEAGRHLLTIDLSGLPTGMYIYRLAAGDAAVSRMLQLIR